jgi:hypothetical protein
MTSDPVRLVPLAGVREVLAQLMDRRDYMGREPCIRLGETETRPLPPDQGLRLADFLADLDGLPDPCPEPRAIGAIMDVFAVRGHHFLISEAAALWGTRWAPPQPAGDGSGPPARTRPRPAQRPAAAMSAGPAAPVTGAVCVYCGAVIRGKRAGAKYCGDSHRKADAKRRKRQADRGNVIPIRPAQD